jgi:hypothetical protein
VAIGDWLQVNSPLGRPEQAFYVQVTGFTDLRGSPRKRRQRSPTEDQHHAQSPQALQLVIHHSWIRYL